MARTPLLSRLQRLARRLEEEERRRARGPRGARVPAGRPTRGAPSRRDVLRAGGAAGALLALAPARLARGLATQPAVAIVGGGLAGLVAAVRLLEKGVACTVYEASPRAGGRVDTDRETFAGGQRVERGGELIDTGHKAYRKLVQELGLKLDDLPHAEAAGTEAKHFFHGAPYSDQQAEDDFQPVFHALKKDLQTAPFPTLYTNVGPAAAALDAMSIVEWIDTRVPGGTSSPFGRLLDVAYNIEYGGESSDQSALNLLYLLGYGASPGNLRLFGASDERYRIAGGNDQAPALLAAILGDAVRLEHRLTSASTLGDGRTRLVFATPAGTHEVVADRAIMTVPFAVLRADVDIAGLALQPRKRTAIEQLGMGTNSKLHVQFATRAWVAQGNDGVTYADLGYQNTWEETRAQSGAQGILNNYTGGLVGASFGSGTPQERAQQFLEQIDPVLPGLGAAWNGLASVDFWPASPWQRGSYSYYRVGQYAAFAGVEREVEGSLHFAGEHTSVDFQGYMEGAVESGERAAAEVLGAL